MQPSYALLPVTSYPKTVGGMFYAVIKAHIVKVQNMMYLYDLWYIYA